MNSLADVNFLTSTKKSSKWDCWSIRFTEGGSIALRGMIIVGLLIGSDICAQDQMDDRTGHFYSLGAFSIVCGLSKGRCIRRREFRKDSDQCDLFLISVERSITRPAHILEGAFPLWEIFVRLNSRIMP